MRPSHVATTFAAVTAGLTAAVALHRRTERLRRAAAADPAAPLPLTDSVPVRDGVVLPFVRPTAPAPAPAPAQEPPEATAPTAPTARARCGDNGGRTKAGAPCGARATTAGRCHHHVVAA